MTLRIPGRSSTGTSARSAPPASAACTAAPTARPFRRRSGTRLDRDAGFHGDGRDRRPDVAPVEEQARRGVDDPPAGARCALTTSRCVIAAPGSCVLRHWRECYLRQYVGATPGRCPSHRGSTDDTPPPPRTSPWLPAGSSKRSSRPTTRLRWPRPSAPSSSTTRHPPGPTRTRQRGLLHAHARPGVLRSEVGDPPHGRRRRHGRPVLHPQRTAHRRLLRPGRHGPILRLQADAHDPLGERQGRRTLGRPRRRRPHAPADRTGREHPG